MQDSMMEVLQFENLLQHLLSKLENNRVESLSMQDITGYKTSQEIPPEKRKAVADMLHTEIKAREILGDEAYFDSVSILSKIAIYNTALDAMLCRAVDENKAGERVTWADFKKCVSAAVMQTHKGK